MNNKKNGNHISKPEEKSETKPEPAQVNQPKPAGRPPKSATPFPVKDAADGSLSTLTAGFIKRKEMYDKQYDALTKRLNTVRRHMEKLKDIQTQTEFKINQLSVPNIKDNLIAPLAGGLLKLLTGYDSYEVVGPLGIQDSVTVSFFEKGTTDTDKASGKRCRSITLVTKPEGAGLGVRNYSQDTKTYAPGTIGYASGLNYPVVKIPDGAKLDWLLDWVK